MWINSLFHRIVLLTKQFDKWLMLGPVLDSAYFGERSFGLGAEIQVFNSPWWTERKNGKTQARTGLGICYLQGKGKSFTTSVSSRCDVLLTNNENTFLTWVVYMYCMIIFLIFGGRIYSKCRNVYSRKNPGSQSLNRK